MSIKKIIMFIGVLTLSMMITACGSSDVKTGGEGNSTEKKEASAKKEAPKKEDGKKFDASSNVKEANGLKVGLGEIKITDGKISVGMNIENTTDKKLNFFPDQGNAVIGDMQLDANMLMTSGKVGGEIQGGVKQDGVIEFLAPEGKKIDVATVKEIKLIFGDVVTEDFMNSTPVEFVVPVK